MNIKLHKPPRTFTVGFEIKRTMQDCGRIELDDDEQVTFTTPGGAEYDVAKKSWGFYATPSLNGRLVNFGLRAVVVKNRIGRYFVLLVEKGKEPLFETYVHEEQLVIVCWLDSEKALHTIENTFYE